MKRRSKKPLKVAIIGKAPSSIAMAPYDDPEWEKWTLSNAAQLGEAPKWDRHVEIHALSGFRDEPTRKAYWDWLCSEPKGKRPIYVQEVVPEMPAAVLFPKSKVVDKFGTYFNNTVSWMICLAILEGVKEIGVFGVDMACDGKGELSEYAHQRPSCEFMLGWAMGMGISVTVPDASDLLKARLLYGFDSDGGMAACHIARTKELQGRLNHANQQLEAASQQVIGLRGALDNARYYDQWALGSGQGDTG